MELLEGTPDAVAAAGSLYRLVTGFYVSRAVFAAAELGLADLLADGPRGAAELAAEAGTDAAALARLLRLLVAFEVLVEADGAYALSGAGELLRSDRSDSMRDMARLLAGRAAHQAWDGLLESLRSGRPALDQSLFAYLADRPVEAAVYNNGIAALTRQLAPALLDAYDFSGFTTLVDVGGGQGALLIDLLHAHPGSRGILLDLPDVVRGAHAPVAAAGVDGRCEIVGGDFLKEVPPGGDAYLLRGVILNWDDPHCVTMLSNCRRAMADNGRVLIVETVMPEHFEPTPSLQAAAGVDLNQMLMLGGMERTEAEYRGLLEASGLALNRIVTVGPSPSRMSRVHSVIEGVPA